MALSRRISSWLMFSFAFLLLLSPAFTTPPAYAQSAGSIDIVSILPAAAQGGIGVIMLVVYLVQSKKEQRARDEEKRAREETMKLVAAQLTNQNETTKLAFEKYNERTMQLLEHLKSSHAQSLQAHKESQDTTSLLTGTLSRLEVKLDQPVMCPLKEFSQIKGAQQ